MYHKVILVGNLGRDPEMRYTPNGKSVTNFTVATSEKWTGQDGQVQERTVWWRVSTFGKLAEICNEYLSTGQKVLVEGTINADPKTGNPHFWTGQDGEPRANFELKALVVKFLSSAKNGASEGNPELHGFILSKATSDIRAGNEPRQQRQDGNDYLGE